MIILMYHSLAENDESKERYILSGGKFQEQVHYLSGNHAILTLADFFTGTSGEKKTGIIITFDDGDMSSYTLACPILKEYKTRGVFFVTTSRIGQPGFFSWKEIKELNQLGMEIGSHTVNHRYLPLLREKEIYYELEYSKKVLEDGLGKSVDFLSVPGGGYSQKVARIAKEVGYLGVCTSIIGNNNSKTDHFYLRRISVLGNISFNQFVSLVEGNFYRARTSQMVRDAIKTVLGLTGYEKLKKIAAR